MPLMQVDPRTLGVNLWLIISGLLSLIILALVGLAVWTGIRVCIALIRRQRGWRMYLKESRRADGEPYPPFIDGVCQECGRGDRRIYYPDSGERLCLDCYERFWRRVTGWSDKGTA